ncbi:MAG: hypothetical protein ABR521_14675 [Gaiellaceae bacterium]
MTRRLRTLARRGGRAQGGYTVVELLIVLVVLGTILGSMTALFVSASTAEIEANNRFKAQQNALLALDKIRREAHCASAITPTGSTSSITMTLGERCPSGTGDVTWCTTPVDTARYGLYRAVGTSCLTTGPRLVDYLITANIFSYSSATMTARGILHVNLPVNLRGTSPAHQTYELVDDIVARNTSRG